MRKLITILSCLNIAVLLYLYANVFCHSLYILMRRLLYYYYYYYITIIAVCCHMMVNKDYQ